MLDDLQHIWADVCAQTGRDDLAYRAEVIWQKSEGKRVHGVLHLRGDGEELVLKHVFRAGPGVNLRRVATANLRAAEMLRRPPCLAPKVHFASVDGATLLMDFVPGKTLDAQLALGKPIRPLLRRAGRWLAAFHRAGGWVRRPFACDGLLAHVDRISRQVAEGTLAVVQPGAFLRVADAFATCAERAAGQPCLTGPRHGDFNTRNLILGPEGDVGLDFVSAGRGAVAFDLARMMMDVVQLHPDAAPDDRTLVGHTVRQAMLDGYGKAPGADAVLECLLHLQLLNDWKALPHVDEARSLRQDIRLARILQLARRLGAGTQPPWSVSGLT